MNALMYPEKYQNLLHFLNTSTLDMHFLPIKEGSENSSARYSGKNS